VPDDLADDAARGGPTFAIPTNWTFRDDGVAAGFERHVREQLPWFEQATGAMAHVARHYIPDGGLVYDIGASTGNVGRAIAPALEARGARLVPIEVSPQMAARYDGPQPGNLLVADVREVAFEPFDLAVCFLTLMFVPVADRPALLARLRAACRPGGAIVVFDKCEARAGYAATVLWRLALAGKVATGVPAEEIVAKELSLGGVQRPLDPAVLGPDALEFFRFGEFAGWLIEGGAGGG
jgi:tRNA (cmo5U34)-methyltransferase